MNIYVNGDSYTAGYELADDILPGYPGLTAESNIFVKDFTADQKKWAGAKWNSVVDIFGSINNYYSANKQHAWPAEISRLDPTIKIINGARNGASMVGIANRTVADILEAKENNIEYNHVFIQLTSTFRFEIYDKNTSEQDFILDSALSWASTLPANNQRKLAESYIAQYKDIDYCIKFLYTLVTLKYAVKGLTGKYPIILIAISLFTDQVLKPLENETNPRLQALLKDSGILDIPSEEYMEYIHTENKFLYTPLSHFEKRTHQLYAQQIYRKYLA
jgi:hypothetical protein